MGIAEAKDYPFEDVVYLVHGDTPQLARIFIPEGKGPFPAIIEIHGGAWTLFDRTRGKSLHEALVRSGIAVIALDYRQGAEGAYPLSVADIHYGIRWVKANAKRLNIIPDRVGLSGNSSGGHLGMLIAMRPHDSRYAAIPLPLGSPDVDASLTCVVMLWPLINPLGRYRNAQRSLASDDPAEWAERIVRLHDGYWRTVENMEEGNPMLALERGEKVLTPPAMWVQSTEDKVHNYKDTTSDFDGTEAERFVANYRKAGGEIELRFFDAPSMFTTVHPTLPESIEALDQIVDFVHRYI